MAVIKKLLVSSMALAGVAGLLLLGGVMFNGTISAFSTTHSGDGPGACESAEVDQPGKVCDKKRDALFEQGKQVFRFDTFGDEDFWGGQLQLQKAIEGAALG